MFRKLLSILKPTKQYSADWESAKTYYLGDNLLRVDLPTHQHTLNHGKQSKKFQLTNEEWDELENLLKQEYERQMNNRP